MSKHSLVPHRIEERMKHFGVPGVGIAVFRNGQLTWRTNYGVMEAGLQHPVEYDSLFHACSISKMVTAIGVLRLVQEGQLDLDKDINHYLISLQIPENKYTAHNKVTLRHLLSHQAGFIDPDGSFDVYQKQDPFPTPKDILLGNTRYYQESVQVKYVPGSHFSYSDAGYTVIEQVIEDVTNESFSAVMERVIMEPIGLKKTFFWDGSPSERSSGAAAGHDKQGRIVEGKRAHYPNLSGAGLWTTPTELSLISLEVIKAWNGERESILQPEITKSMLTGSGCDKGVGLGVFLPQLNEETYMLTQGWGVGFQCKMVAYPHLKSGIVVMTNSEPDKPQNEALVGEVIREICKRYDWPEL